jgi:hypothetical protein
MIYTQFMKATAYRVGVSKVTEAQACQSCADTRSNDTILEVA